MGAAFVCLILGIGLAVLGVMTLKGWRQTSYRRPALGAWAGIAGGVGLAGGAGLRITDVFDGLGGAACTVLVGGGLLLLVLGGPSTRFDSRKRGDGR